MRSTIRILAGGLALCLGATAAQAVVLGVADTFEDGSTNGWHVGAGSPLPPVNVASGGPAGVDDNFVLMSSTGSGGAGSRLAVMAGAQWLGDYVAVGVSAITMDLRNLGTTDLTMRLVVFGSNGGSGLAPAATVVAGGGWQMVSFGLSGLVANGPVPLPLLTAVSDLRLFHDTGAGFPPGPVAGQLGMDNVTAVPELPSTSLLACGLLALAWSKRLRLRLRPRPPATFG